MKLSYDALTIHLKKTLSPIYLLYGNEPFLLNEAAHRIRQTAKTQGFDERIRFHAPIEWEKLRDEANHLSLFSQKRLIDLYLPNGKIGDEGIKILAAYADAPPPDLLLLITIENLERAQQQTKWFQSLSAKTTVLQVFPLQGVALTKWIGEQLKNVQLTLTPDAITLLAQQTQGHLLAAHQEIEKLSLLYGHATLDASTVEAAIAEHARFDLFEFIDVILRGDLSQTLRVLSRLEQEGIEPILILWGIARELRVLIALHHAMKNGKTLEQALQSESVFQRRHPLVKQGVSRLSLDTLQDLLLACQRVDEMIKGLQMGNVWDALAEISCTMTGNSFWKSIDYEKAS